MQPDPLSVRPLPTILHIKFRAGNEEVFIGLPDHRHVFRMDSLQPDFRAAIVNLLRRIAIDGLAIRADESCPSGFVDSPRYVRNVIDQSAIFALTFGEGAFSVLKAFRHLVEGGFDQANLILRLDSNLCVQSSGTNPVSAANQCSEALVDRVFGRFHWALSFIFIFGRGASSTSLTARISGSIFRKVSTTFGSNCRPLWFLISAIASSIGHAFLYGRVWINASNTSATATMRPSRGIASPFNLAYPVPSHFSW